jgi:hypothetical protein
MQHQLGAGGMQAPASRRADAFCTTRDQDHFALHAALRLH